MKPLFRCDNCGALKYVLFDGYDFGDRVLEGLIFKGYKDGSVKLGDASDKAYFSTLNKKMWLETAKKFFSTLDIGQCPDCKADCDVWEDDY